MTYYLPLENLRRAISWANGSHDTFSRQAARAMSYSMGFGRVRIPTEQHKQPAQVTV